MKKLFLATLILSFNLIHLSILQARPTETPEVSMPSYVDPVRVMNAPITEIPTSPTTIPTATCDLDGSAIKSIQFYVANCDHPNDSLVEFCAWSGLAYHSYCNTSPRDSARECIERHACNVPSITTPPTPEERTPSAPPPSPSTPHSDASPTDTSTPTATTPTATPRTDPVTPPANTTPTLANSDSPSSGGCSFVSSASSPTSLGFVAAFFLQMLALGLWRFKNK